MTCEVVDALAEGDAAEREAFYGQADEVEAIAADAARKASALEAKAMAVSTDRSVLAAGPRPRERSPMGLDDVVRAVFSSQLEVPSENGARGTLTRSSKGTSTPRRTVTRRSSSLRSESPPPTSWSRGA